MPKRRGVLIQGTTDIRLHNSQSMRCSYSSLYKARIIARYDVRLCKKKVAEEAGIDKRNVIRWIGQREAIMRSVEVTGGMKLKLHSGRPVQHPISEQRLHDWFIEERNSGRAVSNKILSNKMRQYVGRIFSASPRWLQGFFLF